MKYPCLNWFSLLSIYNLSLESPWSLLGVLGDKIARHWTSLSELQTCDVHVGYGWNNFWRILFENKRLLYRRGTLLRSIAPETQLWGFHEYICNHHILFVFIIIIFLPLLVILKVASQCPFMLPCPASSLPAVRFWLPIRTHVFYRTHVISCSM